MSEIIRTAFDARQRALGGDLVDWEGWYWPNHFGDPIAEHNAVRTAVGVWDASPLRKWRFRGADALRAADYAFTNDMASLEIGQEFGRSGRQEVGRTGNLRCLELDSLGEPRHALADRRTVASIWPWGCVVATKISPSFVPPNGDRSTSQWWRFGMAMVTSLIPGSASSIAVPITQIECCTDSLWWVANVAVSVRTSVA